MVDLCLVVKQSGIQMAIWKPNWEKPVNGPKFWYWNGLPSHVTLPFENNHTPILSGVQMNPVFKCSVFIWSAKSYDFTIWIQYTHTVWYSDESGIQVFSIQMVTVFQNLIGFFKLSQVRLVNLMYYFAPLAESLLSNIALINKSIFLLTAVSDRLV